MRSGEERSEFPAASSDGVSNAINTPFTAYFARRSMYLLPRREIRRNDRLNRRELLRTLFSGKVFEPRRR